MVFLFKCEKESEGIGEGVGGCGKERVGFIKPRKEQGLILSENKSKRIHPKS